MNLRKGKTLRESPLSHPIYGEFNAGLVDYLRNVVSGKYAKQGIQNIDTLAQQAMPQINRETMRASPGSPQAALDLAMQFAPLGITAYHASPHKLDKFRMDKIGTGEGAQAYGHGLYFSESPAVSGKGGQYWKQFGGEGKAHAYKVDIADNAVKNFLDWDKPLSQQHEVQAAIKNHPAYPAIKSWLDGHLSNAPANSEATGQALHEVLTQKLGGQAAVSDFLRSQGILGIKYLDQGSRTAGKGTSNYAVFDEDIIKILENGK